MQLQQDTPAPPLYISLPLSSSKVRMAPTLSTNTGQAPRQASAAFSHTCRPHLLLCTLGPVLCCPLLVFPLELRLLLLQTSNKSSAAGIQHGEHFAKWNYGGQNPSSLSLGRMWASHLEKAGTNLRSGHRILHEGLTTKAVLATRMHADKAAAPFLSAAGQPPLLANQHKTAKSMVLGRTCMGHGTCLKNSPLLHLLVLPLHAF